MRDVRHGSGRVYGAGPKSSERYNQVERIQNGATTVSGREKHQKCAAHRPSLPELLDLVFPASGFAHVFAYPGDENRRNAAHRKHVAPTKTAANKIIGDSCQEESNVVTGVHQGRAHGTAFFRPVLGDKRRPNSPLSADSNASQEANNRQSPNPCRESGQEGKERKGKNAEHHGAHAAKTAGIRCLAVATKIGE